MVIPDIAIAIFIAKYVLIKPVDLGTLDYIIFFSLLVIRNSIVEFFKSIL